MTTLGLELSDAGLLAARLEDSEPSPLDVPDRNGAHDWPGFCYSEGSALTFGRAAEDLWFVYPRRVVHNFWARLAHEPSTLSVHGKPHSFSELAYFFLSAYWSRLSTVAGKVDRVALAIPGMYLKDDESEEEKIGLLLGMAGELKLPLVGFVDLACASLCDPRIPGFNQALPVVVIDLTLDGADLTLLTVDGKLGRRDFLHLPQCGLAQLLKQLTSTLGNRFLRHTAFDILEDGRIEQTFFRQTKDFLLSGAPEFRFLINTASRAYEMPAKREQLVADSQSFAGQITQGLQTFLHDSPHASEPCTIALTDRAAHLPGIEQRLRSAGFLRIIRLPRAAAACGAARIGALRLSVPADLTEVPLETAVPASEVRSLTAAPWQVRLQKLRGPVHQLPATHAVLAGIGHPLGSAPRFTIGLSEFGPNLVLPHEFGANENLNIELRRDNGRLWFEDPGVAGAPNSPPAGARTPVLAGDRLEIRSGALSAEVLFVHCAPVTDSR